MKTMKTILRIVDRVSEWVGLTGRWIALALLVIVTVEVIRRYVFNSPTTWAYQASVILGGSLFILYWGYAEKLKTHIRIDLLYGRLSLRGKALVDVLGFAIFFLPLFVALIKVSFSWMLWSWQTGEKMSTTIWYPPAAPFRAVAVIGLSLCLLQFLASFIRDLYTLIKGAKLAE